MSDYIRQLHEKRMRAWEQAKELLDHAADEKRDLSAEEETSYRRMNEDIEVLDGRIKEYMEADQRRADAEAQYAAIAKAAPADQRGVDAEAELRSFARGERGRVLDVKPESRTTLGKGQPGGTTGGNTVRTDFYTRLVQHLIEVSGVLQAGPTVLSTSGGEALQIPKTAAHSANASLVAENAALSQNEPTFGMVTLDAFKYGFLMQVTHELLNDTSVDLMGYLSMQAGRALGNGFGAHLVTGDGSSKPNGVQTVAALPANVGKTGATAGGLIVADDLIDLFYSVISSYRNSASCGWLMKDSTVGAIRKLKDSTNQYIWQPGLQAGAPDTILGKSVHVDPNMPAVASTAVSVLFGDFSTYFVRRVEAIRFERSDDFGFNTDVVTFRAILRGDGDQIDTTGAIKSFKGAV